LSAERRFTTPRSVRSDVNLAQDFIADADLALAAAGGCEDLSKILSLSNSPLFRELDWSWEIKYNTTF